MALYPLGFIEPCLPTVSRTVPTGAGWAYEIKHDAFRFICRREGERVQAFSRGGHDWNAQLPAVVEAMRALPVTSVTLDGEVVICGADGVSQFLRMSVVFGRRGSRDAFLYAFDLLELDGRDLRNEPWARRRAALAQLLAAADAGIRLCEHIEDTDGAVVFRAACNMGLEGIVAKRRDSRYRSGRCRDWIKIKNPTHPAIERAMLIALSKRQGSEMAKNRHPPGPPMDIANVRRQGVRGLAVYCLNHACQHRTVIRVDDYPDEIEVPSFGLRVKCSRCGAKRIDVRPNWKEKPDTPDSWQGHLVWET